MTEDRTSTAPGAGPDNEPSPLQGNGSGKKDVYVLGGASNDEENGGGKASVDIVRGPLTGAFIVTLFVAMGVECWWNAMVAVTIMLVYFVLGLWLEKGARNSERFADSLYYQGFILTLFALFLAMKPWQTESGLSSQDIIQKFGMAISTTFVGMSLRIILIQFRPTVSDQEEEARGSIAGYVLNLNSEINNSLNEIRSFREKVTTEMQEASGKFTQVVDASGKAACLEFEKNINELPKMFGTASSQFVAAVENGTKVLSAIGTTLQTIETQARLAIEASKAEAAKAIGDTEKKVAQAIGEREKAAAVAIANSESQAARVINDGKGMVDLTLNEVATFAKEITAAAAGVQALVGASASFAKQLSSLEAAHRETLEKSTLLLASTVAKLNGVVQRANQDAERTSQVIADSAKKLTDAIKEAGRLS